MEDQAEGHVFQVEQTNEGVFVGIDGTSLSIDESLMPVELSCHLEVVGEDSFGDGQDLRPIAKSTPTKPPLTAYQCGICAYTTKVKSNYKRHLRRHDDSLRQYICGTCDKSFTEKFELGRHCRRSHSDVELLCELCSKSFKSATGLVCHKRVKHNQGAEGFGCEACSKVFYNKSDKRDHLLQHADTPMNFRCTKCSKTVSTKKSLTRHQKVCGGPRLRCEICQEDFATLQIKKDHIESKHCNKQYRCSCGKTYRWRPSYCRHRRLKGHDYSAN